MLACLVFLPSLQGGLVGWDDWIITDSPRTREFSAGSIFRAFVPEDGIGSSYQPLRAISFSLVYALSGSSPAGYLLFNLLLYLVNVFLFYSFAAHLSGKADGRVHPAAVAAAFLFAVHPVHVEVVSWHQGSKMALMGMFYLLSLLGYIRFRSGEGERYYWFCLAAFVASLLTQPAAVSLPFVLVAYELTFRPAAKREHHSGGMAAVFRLAPFFLPAAALAFHLLFISTVRLGAGSGGDAPLLSRLAVVPVVWGKSLLKLALPVNLCARYPLDILSEPQIGRMLAWTIICAAAVWGAIKLAPTRRAGLFALLFFAVTILPTSGLVETSTLLADRYLYLPGMAVFLAAGWGIQRLTEASCAKSTLPHPGVPGAAVLLLALTVAGLAATAVKRQGDWSSGVSLWSRVVDVYPGHSLGHFNLAGAWNARGNSDQAFEHYRRALEIDPGYGDAYANLSTLVLNQGRTGLARQLIEKAAELRPDRAEVWIKHGIVMASTGEDSTAEASFLRAIGMGTEWLWAGHFNLGMLYAGQGDSGRAREHMRQALELATAAGKPLEVRESIRGALDNLEPPDDR